MIDEQHGRILIECDSCNEVFEGEKGQPWNKVWDAAKRDGWRSRLIDEVWLHGCPVHGVPKK